MSAHRPCTACLRIALPLALSACGSGAGGGNDAGLATSTRAPCDALAPPATSLAPVLGAGKDGAGTIYVADPRVFLTSGGVLYRQHVAGSGESSQVGYTDYSLTFQSATSDGSDARMLYLTVQGGKATAMAIGPPGGRCFLSEGCPGTTALALVDPSAVAGMAIVNLPGRVEWICDVEGGDVLVVTTPMDPDTAQGFRVFYGPPGAAKEGVITAMLRGMQSQIIFTLDGQTYKMVTTWVDTPDAGSLGAPGPGSLTLPDGSKLGFTERTPPPQTLAGVTTLCLTP